LTCDALHAQQKLLIGPNAPGHQDLAQNLEKVTSTLLGYVVLNYPKLFWHTSGFIIRVEKLYRAAYAGARIA
jgi:hypothetical protein